MRYIMNADLALQELLCGNKRFVELKSIHPHQNDVRRKSTVDLQQPIAVVVTCSDSRVPPEIILDQGLGDLFVVRIAGNILNKHVIGSIEYAVKYVDVPLIMVIGHENCAAIDVTLKNISTQCCMDNVLETIRQNVGDIDPNQHDALNIAIKKNVNAVINNLKASSPTILQLINDNKVKLVGAYYHFTSGIVDIIS
ncbi:MAG TPA: carbonic anhydrase [Cyanobacteria bacterium UBA9579]|nr:carbonic anhydrase [Cyanobacteria bacterium UBA9579]